MTYFVPKSQVNPLTPLAHLLTVSEVGELLGYASDNALYQPRVGITDRFGLLWTKIGRQRAYFPLPVYRFTLQIAKKPIRGPARIGIDKTRAIQMAVDDFNLLIDRLETERPGRLGEWMENIEVRAALGVTSRERVYQLSDLRDGTFRTVPFGAITLFWRDDVDRFVNQRKQQNSDRRQQKFAA